MSKIARTPIDPHAGPPRASGGRWGAMLLIALIASPLLFDGAMLGYARWMAQFGPMPIVRTPVLDAVGSYAARAGEAIVSLATDPLRREWGREYAVGALVASLAVGVLLMRSHRLR